MISRNILQLLKYGCKEGFGCGNYGIGCGTGVGYGYNKEFGITNDYFAYDHWRTLPYRYWEEAGADLHD